MLLCDLRRLLILSRASDRVVSRFPDGMRVSCHQTLPPKLAPEGGEPFRKCRSASRRTAISASRTASSIPGGAWRVSHHHRFSHNVLIYNVFGLTRGSEEGNVGGCAQGGDMYAARVWRRWGTR